MRDQTSDAPIGAVTFSAGVATIADDSAAALRAADEALYLAKKAGKDQVMASE
jgi:diguanylate cyclase